MMDVWKLSGVIDGDVGSVSLSDKLAGRKRWIQAGLALEETTSAVAKFVVTSHFVSTRSLFTTTTQSLQQQYTTQSYTVTHSHSHSHAYFHMRDERPNELMSDSLKGEYNGA